MSWMIEALTALLVLITGYYAFQNREMAKEMRLARGESVFPHVVLRWHSVGPKHSLIRVTSVGKAAALNVDVMVTLCPAHEEDKAISRRLQMSVMTPGESEDIIPSRGLDQGFMTMTELVANFDRVELNGSAQDIMGGVHQISGQLADLAEWRRIRQEALVNRPHPDFEKRLGKELTAVVAPIVAALSKLTSGR
ncbi:MAG: hypothetical protein EON59_10935 [Alphaproteobacteria bacterium]|nr:MAG: hypothetical protein EON59_10935 [Alphaproteobacteria bacterium]